MCDEFPVLTLVLDGIEVPADFGDAVRVADGQDRGGQFFRPEVEVVNGAPAIEDKFRFFDGLHDWR